MTGPHHIVAVEKTRPANVTAYAANDVISESTSAGTVWTFKDIGFFPGGSGYIVKARVTTDFLTGQTQLLRLYLFNATPTGQLNDNEPNTEPKYADEGKMVSSINFAALDNVQASADSAISEWDDLGVPFVCAAESQDLLGILITLDGFTPKSGQKFTVTLEVEPG